MNPNRPAFDPVIQKKISDCGVVAVLVIDDAKQAVPLARSLLAGGINAMEIGRAHV